MPYEEGTEAVIDGYNVRPVDIKQGDTMLFIIKMIVTHGGYRLYRCPLDPTSLRAMPQGARVYTNEQEIAEVIFPAAVAAGLKPDPMG